MGGSGSKEEMRAVLVKIGDLLAPNHFTVAIGDREPSTEEDTAKEQQEEEGEREKEEGEEEGKVKGCEGIPSESGDSEYPGVMGVREERKEEEHETEKARKGGEKLYEILKQQVEGHKMEVVTSDDADRSATIAQGIPRPQ